MRSIAEIFKSFGELDGNGRHVNGTDKMTNHNYGDAYEQVLGARRTTVTRMLEIGVADGSSLLAWREIFPFATIVGMDIHHSDKAHGDRIEFCFGDQRVKEHCEAVAAGRKFDVIVEDALHEIDATLLTLYWMWPHVAPGGLYIVEEWAGVDRDRITALFPQVEVVDTLGPFGGNEPLIVFRKPRVI